MCRRKLYRCDRMALDNKEKGAEVECWVPNHFDEGISLKGVYECIRRHPTIIVTQYLRTLRNIILRLSCKRGIVFIRLTYHKRPAGY